MTDEWKYLSKQKLVMQNGLVYDFVYELVGFEHEYDYQDISSYSEERFSMPISYGVTYKWLPPTSARFRVSDGGYLITHSMEDAVEAGFIELVAPETNQ